MTLNVPGRCVCSEALDEERHRDDEADAHQEDTVPNYRDDLVN